MTPDARHTIVVQIIIVCIWDVPLSVLLSTDLCFNWTWKWSCHHNNSQSTGQVSIPHNCFWHKEELVTLNTRSLTFVYLGLCACRVFVTLKRTFSLSLSYLSFYFLTICFEDVLIIWDLFPCLHFFHLDCSLEERDSSIDALQVPIIVIMDLLLKPGVT